MQSIEKLKSVQQLKRSILCVGIDPDIAKLPDSFKKEPPQILDFNKAVIDATSDFAASYKLNFAFFEQYGIEGIEILKRTFEYIPKNIFTIADAKRGDIGNTSAAYAKSAFEYFGADSITVNPYMGYDSVSPFLDFKDKMTFLLALTSNTGSSDFQRIESNGKALYKEVVSKSSKWAGKDNIGYVVGATHPLELEEVRDEIPDNFLLVPGVGAQGGDIEAILKANRKGPVLINVSRAIIYASKGSDYKDKIREAALFYHKQFGQK